MSSPGGVHRRLRGAMVSHDTPVDLSRQVALEAADDLPLRDPHGRAASEIGDGRFVKSQPDDDRTVQGRVRLSVPASVEAMMAQRWGEERPTASDMCTKKWGADHLGGNHVG